jgi:hypothetical protein
LATELAYGAIRQRRVLDAWLDRLGKVPASKQPPKLRWLLHVGLYQLLLMERIPSSAAVNTTVELAKMSGLARLAPVVNGLLRGVLRAHEAGVQQQSLLRAIKCRILICASIGCGRRLSRWVVIWRSRESKRVRFQAVQTGYRCWATAEICAIGRDMRRDIGVCKTVLPSGCLHSLSPSLEIEFWMLVQPRAERPHTLPNSLVMWVKFGPLIVLRDVSSVWR